MLIHTFRSLFCLLAVSLAGIAPGAASAVVLDMPEQGDLVGEIYHIQAYDEDTFVQLARAYKKGYTELRVANPDVDPWLPGEGTLVTIPERYILPNVPREGIVINVAEMRLYYFPPGVPGERRTVETYPIGVGREAFPTPEFSSQVRAKIENPAWYPPQAVIEDAATRGVFLPRTVPPGPDNPLGQYAIQLGIPGYFIHGTNRPAGVGMRVSAGCIRLFPEDIATLIGKIDIGIPVRSIHQPVKVGKSGDRIYVEIHPGFENDQRIAVTDDAVIRALEEFAGDQLLLIDWDVLAGALQRQDGMPYPVASFLSRS